MCSDEICGFGFRFNNGTSTVPLLSTMVDKVQTKILGDTRISENADNTLTNGWVCNDLTPSFSTSIIFDLTMNNDDASSFWIMRQVIRLKECEIYFNRDFGINGLTGWVKGRMINISNITAKTNNLQSLKLEFALI